MGKYTIITAFLCLLCFNCQKNKGLTLDDVLANYKQKVEAIDQLSYKIRRVDTFAQGGEIWDNTGFAHLEKRKTDTIFGFSFYGKRDDLPVISIYDNGKTFTLDQEEMMYELGQGGFYYTGSPGGQMISTSFFSLDTVFATSELLKSEKNYVIKYTFPDDTTYMVKNRVKTVELDSNFIPVKVKSSSLVQGNKSTTDLFFTELKLNDETKVSIKAYKDVIKDYTLVVPEEDVPSSLIGKKLPIEVLTDLRTGEETEISKDKLVLLDFWEVWCGWCIKAFPDVEALQKTYSEDLVVYGITTEDKEKAIELLDKKNVTFGNYFEDTTIHKLFEVRSFPKYYLVNSSGVIVEEYFGFDEDIENNIKTLINERK